MRRPTPILHLLLAALFCCLCRAPSLFAQPADVNRVLRKIDFEERKLGNPEDLPMHWVKVVGQHLPHYVNGTLTNDRAHQGRYSFRFDLDGGSVIYRYESPIKVMAGAHYRVECFAATTLLPRARARLTAYMVDVDKHPLPRTVTHSDPYAATAEGEGWKRLAVSLSAEDPKAAFLVIELGLLQPELYAQTALGDRALFTQDIRGSAWFDDVSVSQVPQVQLSTDRPGNIFRQGETLKLQVHVNDRFTDDLAALLIVRDAKRASVFQRSGALDMGTAETVGPGEKRLSLLLPNDLAPGWYEAALVMNSKGVYVGEQTLDFVLLADGADAKPDPRFGIIATSLPFEGWDQLPDLVPHLGAGRVKLAVWSAAGDVQQLDSASFDSLLERLAEQNVTPTACLVGLPPAVSQKLETTSWTGILKARKEDWQPQLAYLISRHANHLDRWQLGEDGSDAFVTQPAMRDVYAAVYREFASLMEKPDLAMPWPSWYELEGQLPATVALAVPPSVLPSQLPLYMQELKGKDGHNLSLSIKPLDAAQYGREMAISDLAQRVIYALAADAKRIDLPLPFTVKQESGAIVKQPQEMLIIVRTLINTLGGATYRGQVPVADGVEAFLFDKDGTGILALWDRGNASGVKQLEINAGQRPLRIDLWGNTTPLVASAKDKEAGRLQLNVGPLPVFLIDVDGPLAQLRASVAFNNPLVESSFQPHARRLKFTNPYKQAIAGSFKLKPPPGWTITPPALTFNLNPGETFDREITIEFPYNSLGGEKRILADFSVQADRNASFSVPIALKLGLNDVGMQSLAIRDGADVVVQQVISNYGDKPIDYTAFAICPGQARQERLVTNLGPGRTTVKRYRFPNVPPAPAANPAAPAAKVRVGVKELVGTRILNDEIAIQ